VIEIPVVWGEMDAFQQVNNGDCFRYLETARMAHYERLKNKIYPSNKNLDPNRG